MMGLSLESERATDYKSEYLDGEVFAMGAASARHVLIVTNVVSHRHPCSGRLLPTLDASGNG
jgi:hypothetical protein